MKNISGKTALVTGGSSGLGVDFAHILAEKGCHLILVARRRDKLQSVRQEIIAKHAMRWRLYFADIVHRRLPTDTIVCNLCCR